MEIISKKEAMERGLKYYFTGKPCKHGHIFERLVSNNGCVYCLRERAKAYDKKMRQRRLYRWMFNVKA